LPADSAIFYMAAPSPVTRSPSVILRQLQKGCARTLKDYLRVAREGCDLLTEIQEFPVSADLHKEIQRHRRLESESHTAYTMARRRLWDFLNSRNNGKPDPGCTNYGIG